MKTPDVVVSYCLFGLLSLVQQPELPADLATRQTEQQTYSPRLESCGGSDLEMMTIVLSRGFHSDELVCNKEKRRQMLQFSFFLMC